MDTGTQKVRGAQKPNCNPVPSPYFGYTVEKELAQLRAKLDRLRKREHELLQELFDVRAEAEMQSKKIDDIAKMQPVPAIGRLPVEVFSRILHFALYITHDNEWDLHPRQKQQLAGVSRRWRDVILNSPSLWSAICMGRSWTPSSVEMHVARSYSSVVSPPDFGGPLPAFSKVHYVCLRSLTSNNSVSTVCRAFPNVWHFKLEEHASGFFYGLREDTDFWGDLECVTFHSLRTAALEGAVTELQEWLRRRKPTGTPLHVPFTRVKFHYNWEKTGHLFSMLYASLHENCTFEVDDFPLTERMRMTSLTPRLHMDLPHVPPCVVNMRLGEDVPWRESIDDVPENDSSDSEEEEVEFY